MLTAGGAQALAKGQGVLPGKRVLLAGAGPFLLPVAAQLASLGADVVAVAEATRRREWLAAGPRMAAYPQRLAEYAKYRTKVRRIVWGHVIVRAEGDGRVQHATLAEAAPDWSPTGAERGFEVDAVCTAYGFLPSVDLARALGCELAGDAVAHNEDMATSVAGVFVAGEATGVGGAELALAEGELAGFAAAAHASTPLTAGIDGHAGSPREPPPGRARRARSRPAARPPGQARELRRHPRGPLRPASGPAAARRRRHDAVPLRGRHRGRGRRRRRGRRHHALGAEGRHSLRPGPVPGPRVRAAGRRPRAGARALQRPGSDPADPARPADGRGYGLVVLSVNVSVFV